MRVIAIIVSDAIEFLALCFLHSAHCIQLLMYGRIPGLCIKIHFCFDILIGTKTKHKLYMYSNASKCG